VFLLAGEGERSGGQQQIPWGEFRAVDRGGLREERFNWGELRFLPGVGGSPPQPHGVVRPSCTEHPRVEIKRF
jgi:hypothetical protein